MNIEVSPRGVQRMEITLFEFAQKFQGLREIAGPNRHHPAILAALQLDDAWPQGDETPWCAAAINALAWMMGLPRPRTLHLMARSWLDVGRDVGPMEARPGWDIVILWRGSRTGSAGHVGIFAGFSKDGQSVRLLGGNQGDEFNFQWFPVSRVLGYRRLYG